MTVATIVTTPYPGPRPFETHDHSRFFGRDVEIADLTSVVVAHRVVLIYAQSGAGKTSLLNAGLIPSLLEYGFNVLPAARVRGLLQPDSDLAAVANVYVHNTLLGWAPEDVDPQSLLTTTLKEFLERHEKLLDPDGFPVPSVIVFDQFEELFSFYPERWRDRQGFFRQVAEALDADPLLRVVFVMREDYVANLDPFQHLLPRGFDTRYRLERLRHAAACAAVEGPLRGTTRTFAPGVAASIVDQLLAIRIETPAGSSVEVAGEFVEPVQLQIACQSLWSELPPDVVQITSEHVHAFGDVHHALRDFYEDTIRKGSAQTGVTEGDLRTWFSRHLITPSGTRGTVFRGQQVTEGMPNATVDFLEDRHIIRAEMRAGARWYELTHDRFIRPIQEANDAWQQRVSATKQHGRMLNLRRLSWAALAVATVAVALMLWVEWRSAKRVKAHELAARALLKLPSEPAYGLCLAVKAAEEGVGAGDVEVQNALRRAIREARLRAVLSGHEEPLQSVAFSPNGESVITTSQDKTARIWNLATGRHVVLAGHQEQLVSGVFSPDGATVLTASWDKTARLWNAATGASVLVLGGHTHALTASAFSADGRLILTASVDHTARIWDAETGAVVRELRGHSAAVMSATFGPSGRKAATVSEDGTVRLWDVGTGESRLLSADNVFLRSVAFSPDENTVVTTAGTTARSWDVSSGKMKMTFAGHLDTVDSAIFNHDGTLVLTASSDGTARLWDAIAATTRFELQGHLAPIRAVAFSPDDTRVLTASDDSTARVWTTGSGANLGVLRGHALSVASAAFSPNGRYVVTGSTDKEARTWDVSEGLQWTARVESGVEYGEAIGQIAVSGDGTSVVTSSADAVVRVWTVGTETPVLSLSNAALSRDGSRALVTVGAGEFQFVETPSGQVLDEWRRSWPLNNVAVLSGGRRFGLFASDQPVRVFDLNAPDPREYSHEDNIEETNLSHNGALLLVAGGETATLYNLDSHGGIALRGFVGSVSRSAFSPDDRWIVTTSRDGKAQVWNTRDGTRVAALEGHDGWITSAVFTADSKYVVTASTDATARLWNVATQQTIRVFRDSDPLTGVALAPPGAGAQQPASHWLATTNVNGTVRIWSLQEEDPIMVLRGDNSLAYAAVSDGGKFVATGNTNGSIQVSRCDMCGSTQTLLALARSRLTKTDCE